MIGMLDTTTNKRDEGWLEVQETWQQPRWNAGIISVHQSWRCMWTFSPLRFGSTRIPFFLLDDRDDRLVACRKYKWDTEHLRGWMDTSHLSTCSIYYFNDNSPLNLEAIHKSTMHQPRAHHFLLQQVKAVRTWPHPSWSCPWLQWLRLGATGSTQVSSLGIARVWRWSVRTMWEF